MSKICIGVLTINDSQPSILLEQLHSLLERYELTIFSELVYEEPFLNQYHMENVFVFSISDSKLYDNCEMLLLPDNCFLNGEKNDTPFEKRMRYLEEILLELLKNNDRIDMFIADSGTQFDEFEDIHIGISDFLSITKLLNTITPPDLHLTISTNDISN